MGCRPRTFSVLFVPAIGLRLSAVDATPVGDEEVEGEEGRERESSGAESLMRLMGTPQLGRDNVHAPGFRDVIPFVDSGERELDHDQA